MPGSLNPFQYDGALAVEDVIDREAETEQLADLAEGGHATRIMAPRRYGKTSLLHKVLAELDRRGLRTVYVDTYGVMSRDEIAVRLQLGYAHLPGRFRRAADKVLKELRFSVQLPPVTLEVGGSRSATGDLGLLQLLDVPARLYEHDGIRTVIVFDEFQSVLGAGAGTDGLMRSVIQHHAKEAAYIFTGSRPGMMRELFDRQDRAFYRQARPIELGPLADEPLWRAIEARFAAHGRDPGEPVTKLLRLVRGHPQRAMLLAHHLFEHTPVRKVAGPAAWRAARSAAYREAERELELTWDSLQAVDQRVLAAVAWGEETLFNRRTLERFDLPRASAAGARKRLLERGELQELADGRHVVTDPLLAEWVLAGRRIPQEDE